MPPARLEPLTGPVRPDRRTGRLLTRLRPGDIALIDHVDLDADTAAALVAARVGAVVNARSSLSGRVPSPGPALLVRHGIPLVDEVGEDLFGLVRDGDRLTVDGETVVIGRVVVGLGVRQDEARLATVTRAAQAGMAQRLAAAAQDAADRVGHQSGAAGLPDLRTELSGRPCVVVNRGPRTGADLSALRDFVRENSPVLIGVDAGADALLDAGYRPDLIVGDLAAVSIAALTSGAELVGRDDADGAGPSGRLDRLNLTPLRVATGVSSDDLALLLAERGGAALIVTVGAHATLGELLDAPVSASTFLTRVRLGSRVVDAARVAALHRPTRLAGTAGVLVGWTLAAMALALAATTVARGLLDRLADAWMGLL